MATLQDYRNERLRKLETLRQLGVEPYPAKSERTHTCAEVLSKYDELAGKEVVVAGRVASILVNWRLLNYAINLAMCSFTCSVMTWRN